MPFHMAEKYRRSRAVRILVGACIIAVVFGAQLYLANLALPVDTSGKFAETPVKRSQQRLVIEEPVFGFPRQRMMAHAGAANESVDVHFDSARLDAQTVTSLLLTESELPPAPGRISYTSTEPAGRPAAGEPCRTFLNIDLGEGQPPPRALHFYQLKEGGGRERYLELKADGAELVVHIVTATPPGVTADTAGCRKALRVGDTPEFSLSSEVDVSVVASAGSGLRFAFRTRDPEAGSPWDGGAEGFYAPFELGPSQAGPDDPLPSLQARRLSITRLQDDGSNTPPALSARSVDGAPLLRIHGLKINSDELRVKVEGKGDMSVNGRAETYDALKRLEDRPILATILGTIDLALLVWFVRLLRPSRDAAHTAT